MRVPLHPSVASQVLVHTGFQDDIEAMKESVVSATNEVVKKHPTASLIVTGHSLGGSMALLAALLLKNKLGIASKVRLSARGRGPHSCRLLFASHLRVCQRSAHNVLQVYTYGQARTGNAAFADMFEATVPGSVRMTNHDVSG